MFKIQTPIDNLFNFIEEHSPVKESRIPDHLKKSEAFENHIKILEDSGLIEIKSSFFLGERIFVFKTDQKSIMYDSQGLVVL